VISRVGSYYVVTEEEFPDGLVCVRCKRQIEPGQPYDSRFDDYENGMMCEELTCVYC